MQLGRALRFFLFFLLGFYLGPNSEVAVNVALSRDNLISKFREQDGKWTFTALFSEKTPLPLFAAERDTGLFVKAILLNREKTLGKDILGATDYYTPLQIMEDFKKAKPEAGKKLTYNQLPFDVFRGMMDRQGLPKIGQDELLENVQFM